MVAGGGETVGLRTPQVWRIRGRELRLDRPLVIGVLNATPDSFSDGGRFDAPASAAERAATLVSDGADMLDIGAESTRPQQATPVDEAEELRRLLPVIRAVRARVPRVPLSVDTTKAGVAEAAIREDVDVVNDVSAGRLDPRMAQVCAAAEVGVILMHSRGDVSDMGTYAHATYDNVVDDVVRELEVAVGRFTDAGVRRERIALDPGIGFAKRTEHSLAVLGSLRAIAALGFPVIVGASRKRFIGEITGVNVPAQRVSGSVGAHVAALCAGARGFRVHDVREHREALDVAYAVLRHDAEATA